MIGNSWTLALLSFLVILISWPMESRCDEDSYNAMLENSPDYLTNDFTNMKRYRDIDYDSFVGLMGRRSAGINPLPSRKRDMDDIFVGLLGRRSSGSVVPHPWRKEEYLQPRGGIFIKEGRLRFQRSV